LRRCTLGMLELAVHYIYVACRDDAQALTPVVRREATIEDDILRGLARVAAYIETVPGIVARLQAVDHEIVGSIYENAVPLLAGRIGVTIA